MARSLLLRCPECGQGKVAKNWRQTYDECLRCGFDFRVEGGFYLGSIYLNYGLMSVVTLAVGLPLVWWGYVPPRTASTVGVIFCVLLGVWFWRYARSLWLGLTYYIDHNVRRETKISRNQSDSLDRYRVDLDPNQEVFECACPFCHTRFHFAESGLKSWAACAFCHERILLVPIRELPIGDKRIRSTD